MDTGRQPRAVFGLPMGDCSRFVRMNLTLLIVPAPNDGPHRKLADGQPALRPIEEAFVDRLTSMTNERNWRHVYLTIGIVTMHQHLHWRSF